MDGSTGEKDWVRGLMPRLADALKSAATSEVQVVVGDRVRLPYTSEIHRYTAEGVSQEVASARYETDIVIRDVAPDGSWVPRIVIECKLGGTTTHDALSYSTKAFTHKHVHPYLRYGFLAGRLPAIPVRLVKHGTYFDFMAAWPAAEPNDAEWRVFVDTLVEEVKTSRTLQSLLAKNRASTQPRYHLLRRPLLLT